MYKSLGDLARMLLPLSRQKEYSLLRIKELNNEENYKKAKFLIKTGKADITLERFSVSPKIAEETLYPCLKVKSKDDEVKQFIKDLNTELENSVKEKAFVSFSKHPEIILDYIAPNIFGLDSIKEAVALQLFCTEPVHMLLLGDPGTGKTEILKSASELHPISSFGLGSGISGAGLGVTVRGNETVLGLLPRADGGLCAIDELNLMKREEYAYLYSAMEKGYITYNKANKNLNVKTDVKILATANPKGDKFVGWMLDTLRDQIPFDSALLSRFHIVFLIRKQGVEGFLHITKKIVSCKKEPVNNSDIIFIKNYIESVEDIKSEFPKEFEPHVVNFMKYIKENEDKFLIEATPRIVVGFVRLCKARARMYKRDKANLEDVKKIKEIIEKSLFIREKS
ncbi:MAG: hypothetical protein V1859_07340 [archaeon]